MKCSLFPRPNLLLIIAMGLSSGLQVNASSTTVETADILADRYEQQVIEWRRHFHQHPELSNREFETARFIADYLQTLGLDVQTGIAKTGVVAVLDSGKPGPVVALRADIDALPVTETANIPFASKARGTYLGKEYGVMHACGHDAHTAMLMGAAKILVEMKDRLRGKVKFIFQPAEEGAPPGERGGAELMVEEGVLKQPDVDVIFGLHIISDMDVNTIHYRPEGALASADAYRIIVKGQQAHGASPWLSVDPIVTAAQIVIGLQTIVSRELELTKAAAVVTVGSIHGGNRANIIPAQVEIIGTIRTLDPEMRKHVHEAVHRKATSIAASMNATAEVTLPFGNSYPVTWNDSALTAKMLPTLSRTAGEDKLRIARPRTNAEDFAYFQKEVPGLYILIGGKPLNVKKEDASAHHTPEFTIDESGMKLGVRALVNLTVDYMAGS